VKFEEVSRCPVCSSDQCTSLFSANDLVHTERKEIFELRQCNSCRTVFTSPRPVTEFLAADYGEGYISYEKKYQPPAARPDDSFLRSWLNCAWRSALPAALLTWLTKPVFLLRSIRENPFLIDGKGRASLDVGCGAGEFVRRLQARGWAAKGIDVSAHAVLQGRTAGLDLIQGQFAAFKFRNSFDLISFNQSLEHMADPAIQVEEARLALRPGGILFVNVPNFSGSVARIFREYWFNLDVPRHLTHFTPRTLSRLIRAHGFELLYVGTLTSQKAILFSEQRARDAGKAGHRWLVNRPGFWAKFFDFTGQGDGIFLVARKPR
jgi:SAM-dependent methyltransferase